MENMESTMVSCLFSLLKEEPRNRENTEDIRNIEVVKRSKKVMEYRMATRMEKLEFVK
jgi:hypothetical protein